MTRAWLKWSLQTPITLASGAVILTGQLNALEDGSLLRDFRSRSAPGTVCSAM